MTTPLLLGLAACVGSSVPQPPGHQPIDPARVSQRSEEASGEHVLEGAPGAAEPGARVWVWNLGNAEPPIVTTSAPDGSFIAVIAAVSSERTFRLQTRSDTGRSEPLDVEIAPGRSSPLPRLACLEIERELVFDDRTDELAIVNDCASEAVLGQTRLRSVTDMFVIDRVAELRLPPGTTATLRISAPGGAVVEDILFVTVTVDGTSFVYPVTLIAD